jgi:hypothetical protein
LLVAGLKTSTRSKRLLKRYMEHTDADSNMVNILRTKWPPGNSKEKI